jgi:hypothetical protein
VAVRTGLDREQLCSSPASLPAHCYNGTSLWIYIRPGGAFGYRRAFSRALEAWEAIFALLEPARGASLLWGASCRLWGQAGDDQSPHRLLEAPSYLSHPPTQFSSTFLFGSILVHTNGS